MILTILAAVAEAELGEIRDRTRKRMRLKFEKNELTGNVPFGFNCIYTFADGTTLESAHALSAQELVRRGRVLSKILVDNHAEQNIIHTMHALRAQGTSLKAIAAHLNQCGWRSKLGNAWQTGHVASVLGNLHTARVLQTSAVAKAA